MAATIDGTDDWVRQANELYWASARSVEAIVGDLGISRSRLYGALEPISAGRVCRNCREPMEFPNRTSRERGIAVCPGCGAEAAASAAGAADSDAVRTENPGVGGMVRSLSSWRGEFAGVAPGRVAMVGGAAALGMMLGVALARVAGGRH